MKNPAVTGAVFLIMLISASCGNMVNDELFNDDQTVPSTGTDGNFGSIIHGEFSTSGKVIIRSSSAEGYYLGATVKDEDIHDNVWLSYIDKNGSSKWSAFLDNNGTDDKIRRIEVIDKDNILVFADRYYPSSNLLYPDVIVIKVNSTAGIVWQRCIGNDEKNIIHGTVLTDDGGFIAAGITVINKTDTTPAVCKPYVIRVDRDGLICWKKDYNKFYNTALPSGIISLGNDEYLLTGTVNNTSSNKITAFYCRIDGSIDEGRGKILKSRYIKSADGDLFVLGNMSNGDSIISVTGLKTDSGDQLCILVMDSKKLKVNSRKNYSFSDFLLPGDIINPQPDSFMLAGLIRYSNGKGVYSIRFDLNGSLKDLNTKYYDSTGYNFINPEFNNLNDTTKIAFISRLNNPGLTKYLFIDRFETSASLRSSPNKVEVIIDDGTGTSDTGIEGEDVAAEAEESVLVEKADPGLLFKRY